MTTADLLREPSATVDSVAHRVGYSSQSAFAAAVLREFGATPGKLRRQH